jgi:hypothetical protein
MCRAEERWASVSWVCALPAGRSIPLSNGAVEQNFHMQLRAIYKLVLEWRRVENGWAEADPRLVENGDDPWLNGMDEFAAMVGIYSRWVIKAGRKDSRHNIEHILEENEDSNHLWARLVIYFSESHWSLLETVRQYKEEPASAEFRGVNSQIELALRVLGVRARLEDFDARKAFDAPADASALDLLIIQVPGNRLDKLVQEMERKLLIPAHTTEQFLRISRAAKNASNFIPSIRICWRQRRFFRTSS